jgi:hypothetical protein
MEQVWQHHRRCRDADHDEGRGYRAISEQINRTPFYDEAHKYVRNGTGNEPEIGPACDSQRESNQHGREHHQAS